MATFPPLPVETLPRTFAFPTFNELIKPEFVAISPLSPFFYGLDFPLVLRAGFLE